MDNNNQNIEQQQHNTTQKTDQLTQQYSGD